MKYRSDFVTNSSSSSFIVGCTLIPGNVEEAAEIWFREQKDFIAPIIVQGLFDRLKEFPIDFDLLLIKAENVSFCHKCLDNNKEESNEDIILDELLSEFRYHEEYGDWNNKTKFEKYKESFIKSAKAKNPEIRNEYDIPIEERLCIKNEWYQKPEVKERFTNEVRTFICNMKGYGNNKPTVFMQGEFSDGDGHLGCELEHGSHWEKFLSYIRFSHH